MRIALSTACFLVSLALAGQQTDHSKLASAINALKSSPVLSHGILGVSVVEVVSGKKIIAVNENISLPTASTQKLMTTATALATLGSGFRFWTVLEHDGKIENGQLSGNLYIRGGGDPTLGSSRFGEKFSMESVMLRWVDAVKKEGIKNVSGAIIARTGLFDEQSVPRNWVWADIANYYGAGLTGLNFNENQYRIDFRPARVVGDTASFLGTLPKLSFLKFINHVLTAEEGTGDQVIVYPSPETGSILLTGTIPKGTPQFSVKGAMTNSALFVAKTLTERLKAEEILIAGQPADNNYPLEQSKGIRQLDNISSPTLAEICRQTNHQSVNLFAEAMLKMLAVKRGSESYYDSAAGSMLQFWDSIGINIGGMQPKDGSGLSPIGSLSPTNMTDILKKSALLTIFEDYYASIPQLGKSGNVAAIGRNVRRSANMHAKSGTIEDARSYAGYFTSKSGSLMCFSLTASKFAPGHSREIGRELVKILGLMAEL